MYLPGSYNHHDLPSKEIRHRPESHNPLPNEIKKTHFEDGYHYFILVDDHNNKNRRKLQLKDI